MTSSHSARWAEINNTGKGDADNNRLLLRQIEDVPLDIGAALARQDPEWMNIADPWLPCG
jgi:hypothetical protein